MDYSTSDILKRGHPSSWSGPVPILGGGWAKPHYLYSFRTRPVREREGERGRKFRLRREKDSYGVRKGSTRIDDGAAKRRRVWSRSFGSRCTHTSRQSSELS